MSKKEITREELESILSTHNISFSDIAKIANMVNTSSNEEQGTSVIKKEKRDAPTIEYTLTKVSYPDFVVTKKSKTQTKELAVAPSCDGYFVRTLRKSGGWEVEPLSGEAWASFFSDCPVDKLITLPEEFYIKTLERGKVFGDGILTYLSLDGIKNMIKDKCAPKYDWNQFKQYGFYSGGDLDIRRQAKIYNLFPIIYKEFANHESEKIRRLIKKDPEMALFVYRVYGIEKTRDFINNYNLCLFEEPLSYYGWGLNRRWKEVKTHPLVEEEIYCKIYDKQMGSDDDGYLYNELSDYIASIPLIRMDYNAFKEYFLYESYRMGYANLSEFIRDWKDTLTMEKTLFGKFREKYPACLPVYHNKLARRNGSGSLYKDKDFISRFNERAEELKDYNWKNDKYSFIVPKTPNDVMEEADMQSNCLVNAHYIERFVGKTSILVFMRKKEDLDRSYITIEIVDGRINQAYLASNRTPGRIDKDNIKAYARHLKLAYAE